MRYDPLHAEFQLVCARDGERCPSGRRSDITLVHGQDVAHKLPSHIGCTASALALVPCHSPVERGGRIGLDIHCRIELCPYFRVVEDQQSFDDHMPLGNNDFEVVTPRVGGEVVTRSVNRIATAEGSHIGGERRPVKRFRRVEIPAAACRRVQVSEVTIVGVHRDDWGVVQGDRQCVS